MRTQILEQAENQKQKLEAEIEQLRSQMDAYQIVVTKASMVYDKLEQTLNKLGLKVDKYYIPNFEAFNAIGEVIEYEKLYMKVQVVKNETNKFRFITFSGYDSKGAGRNKFKLEKKADALSNTLSEAVNCKVSVNPFSLQINEPNSTGCIFMQIKIEK